MEMTKEKWKVEHMANGHSNTVIPLHFEPEHEAILTLSQKDNKCITRACAGNNYMTNL